ncbi:MAG: hypothetical protein HYX90_03815 [Chloroflexi bacterium]|nr:hypothetical protein [Chloroflexota bacterium]
MDKEQPAAEAKKCMVCRSGSEGRVLLKGIQNDKEVWVCTRCLPMLIHGAH